MNSDDFCAWCDAAVYGGSAVAAAIVGFGWLLLQTRKTLTTRLIAGQIIISAGTGFVVAIAARELANLNYMSSVAAAVLLGMMGKTGTDFVWEIYVSAMKQKFGGSKDSQ